MTTGFDLVKAQLHVAAGGRLEGDAPPEIGHAVEARLNAEDPDRDFAPSPGRIAYLDFASGPGVRVDTGVSEGDLIPADFDSMIAKIIAYGRDRDEALARLRRALADTTVIIEGGATNKSFLLDLLDQPEVVDGSADTGWIDRVRAEGRLVATGTPASRWWPPPSRPTRRRRPPSGRTSSRPLTAAGRRPGTRSAARSTSSSAASATGSPSPRSAPTGSGSASGRAAPSGVLDVDGRAAGRVHQPPARRRPGFRVVGAAHGAVHLVEVDGITHRVTRDEGGVLRSPAPALVVATPVEVGATVEAGAPVLVLESMKMETVIRRRSPPGSAS